MSQIAFCLNASTIRPTPLIKKIQVAAEAGYDAIELWSNELTEFVDAGGTLAEVKRALDDAGLAVPTLIALFGWLGSTGAAHVQAIDEAKMKMEQAAAVGAAHVIASPPREAVDLSRGGAQYRELLELGESFGVQPAMEFLGFVQSVYTIEQAWKIVQDADHPNAAIVMDPFHILRGGGEIAPIAKVPGDRVAIWHWNDVPDTKPIPEMTDADRVLPGDGIGPLNEMARLALDAGYSGYVSLELFNEALWARDPLDVARIGLAKTRAFFAAGS